MAVQAPLALDQAFPPLESAATRVLVLGSMPSQKSLALQQYYGHPQNAFWRIMAELTCVPHDAKYLQRASALMDAGVSVWDTIARCCRPGSMDADIVPDTVTVNDFDTFIARHDGLALVLFNGQASAKMFFKHMGKSYLSKKGIESAIMPSTSPSYAAMSLDDKKSAWLQALSAVGLGTTS